MWSPQYHLFMEFSVILSMRAPLVVHKPIMGGGVYTSSTFCFVNLFIKQRINVQQSPCEFLPPLGKYHNYSNWRMVHQLARLRVPSHYLRNDITNWA